MDLRPASLHGECISQEDVSPFKVSKQRLSLGVSSGPARAGASKNLGAFRLKLRLKSLPSLLGGCPRALRVPQRPAFLRC